MWIRHLDAPRREEIDTLHAALEKTQGRSDGQVLRQAEERASLVARVAELQAYERESAALRAELAKASQEKETVDLARQRAQARVAGEGRAAGASAGGR